MKVYVVIDGEKNMGWGSFKIFKQRDKALKFIKKEYPNYVYDRTEQRWQSKRYRSDFVEIIPADVI